MAIFKCKICGGSLDIADGNSVAVCEYCGTKQTVPTTKDEVVANLFNRANNLRLKCEFDKAEQVYEKILDVDNTDAEAHWGLVLCKYGIEYVEDGKTNNKIPTCHRTLYGAVMTDVDYLATIENSDAEQKELYEAEAKVIDKLQKNILNIVNNEEPFDVFICYKETDDDGKRTVDSSISNDIYYQLTQEGFKVFYAPITLEDKLGYEYEPYIFAALNSAKVMLVIGTKPEYFDSVWVRNEWSRYLKLMKAERSKLLIPCYKYMDAYELPDEFAHLQAQDMGKIGFMQDLIRGINKICGNTEPAIKHQNTPVNKETNTSILLERALLHLEAKEWSKANRLLEEILKTDIHMSDVYIGKCMVDLHVMDKSELAKNGKALLKNSNFKLALRFADGLQKQHLQNIIDDIENDIREKKEKLKQKCKAARKACVILLVCIAVVFAGYAGYENLIEPQIKSSSRHLKSADVGDEIIFGKYEQNNISISKEYIEWVVVKKEDDKILALSKYVLDSRKYSQSGFSNSEYHKVWTDCDLRRWLNNDFYEDAFSDEEKSKIVPAAYKDVEDNVFLLSSGDVNALPEKIGAKAYPTKYAISNGVKIFDGSSFNGECAWWLKNALKVYPLGNLGAEEELNSDDIGVRPAIWIDISETK